MVEAATLSLALLKHFMILVVLEEHCNLKRCCEIQVELLHVNLCLPITYVWRKDQHNCTNNHGNSCR